VRALVEAEIRFATATWAGLPMSQLGQKAKYSLRADVFRFALNNGHAVASPP
jgi:hypothetical protein